MGVRTDCGVVCHYVTEVQALGQTCRITMGYKELSMTNTWCASRAARQEAPFHGLSGLKSCISSEQLQIIFLNMSYRK